jgi:hypothetical protein
MVTGDGLLTTIVLKWANNRTKIGHVSSNKTYKSEKIGANKGPKDRPHGPFFFIK